MKKAARITLACVRLTVGAMLYSARAVLALAAGIIVGMDGLASALINSHSDKYSWWVGFKEEAKAAFFYGCTVVSALTLKPYMMIKTGFEELFASFA